MTQAAKQPRCKDRFAARVKGDKDETLMIDTELLKY